MICYLIFSVLIAAAAFTVRRRSLLRLTGAAFYAVQAAFAVRIVAGGLYGETSAVWFAFDAAGTLFYCLLCIVSAFAFFHSKASLHDCDLRQTRTYAGLLMLLTTAIAGAYFASNLAVTWIFLEATTLCSAGIVYHRRTAQALEAAWKYVFVCSTGIAMAYLGILLLAAATDCESLDYATVAAAAPGGSALYLKTAFLLILCGYSCKAELFPLYTVGVDANFAAPAPASALISTGLVNAGFLALLRVYKLLAATEVFPWVKSVLLLVVVSMYVFGHSEAYLQGEDLRSYRLYFALLMLLTTAIAGAYFANNLAVTWIFLEATTLCSAGIIYHRRTAQALEAAWKYVFVCSTGIAMAYLGILLLAAATKCETLSYEAVTEAASSGNPLYLKTAFLLILSGYSCKLELFPLYTVGIDANFAAPAPASALISTGLVNAGFLALLRVYKLLAGTEVFPWVRSVLLIVGILSLGVGALFLRRTNNYKRFLSYSTVENMGIAAIGLGIGGIGVWAAVFHVVCHTLIKSSLFLQIAVVRQVYGNYRINRIGDYIHINRVGAVGLLTGMVVLVAFPPSPLFLSELMILKQTIADGRWWLVTGIMLLLCLVIYFFCSRLLRLCYQPRQDELHPSATDRALSWSALSLLAAAIGLGLWQPAFFRELIDRIASL